jgi:hypothetical protein
MVSYNWVQPYWSAGESPIVAFATLEDFAGMQYPILYVKDTSVLNACGSGPPQFALVPHLFLNGIFYPVSAATGISLSGPYCQQFAPGTTTTCEEVGNEAPRHVVITGGVGYAISTVPSTVILLNCDLAINYY